MTREALLALLDGVRTGDHTVEDAAEQLAVAPFEDLGFAKIDHHRTVRTGFPEVVLASGKTPEQTVEILRRIQQSGVPALATRCSDETLAAAKELLPDAVCHRLARCVTLGEPLRPATAAMGRVAVVCAGTSDLPVAEEAALTAELFGTQVTRVHDVGVAGLHRLLAHLPALRSADVVVACAGMEAALASVLGGLLAVPVIAVPTSVGYGASLNGVAALLGMLNSCSPNVTVVNIDNGFGAGYVAAMIATRQHPAK